VILMMTPPARREMIAALSRIVARENETKE